jgi:hypothetical protein
MKMRRYGTKEERMSMRKKIIFTLRTIVVKIISLMGKISRENK